MSEITVTTDSDLRISSTTRGIINIVFEPNDELAIIEQFKIADIVAAIGAASLLDEIGEDQARAHFEISNEN